MHDPAELRRRIQRLSPKKRRLLMKATPEQELDTMEYSWPMWSHDGQKTPIEDWQTWVIMGGRGFGKTRAGAEYITALAMADHSLKIALVAATLDEARRIMVEGTSGLLAVAEGEIDQWTPSKRRLTFKGGAEATLFSGASPEMLRGPEHHIAWCDELAKWEKPGDSWDMLQLGLRLGTRPRALVTTTPRPGPVLRRIMAAPGCVVTGGSTQRNPHLPPNFIATVEDMFSGTRLGRQEMGGELLSDTPGALWTVDLIEKCRLPAEDSVVLNLRRTVIGVDPPSGDGTCGIIACALDEDGIGHVLADHSVTARSPEGWARAVAAAAELHAAGFVIVENNQGGQMVEAVLRGADSTLRVKPVTATISKSDRATPIALRFEAGKVRLCGAFPELEAQLCGLIGGGGYEGPGTSPDRADAMVWALTELMVRKERVEPRVRVM